MQLPGSLYKGPQRAKDTQADLDPKMQPLAAKFPLSHKTSFSVDDILDPTKFTRRLNSSAIAEGEKIENVKVLRTCISAKTLSLNKCIP